MSECFCLILSEQRPGVLSPKWLSKRSSSNPSWNPQDLTIENRPKLLVKVGPRSGHNHDYARVNSSP